MTPTRLEHPDGFAEITDLPNGKRQITIHAKTFTPAEVDRRIETGYPLDLIRHFFAVKGLRSFTDEIRREEDPLYTRVCLETELLAYLSPEDARGKRLLDFGCGAGASAVILGRLFPDAEIVGIDLEAKLIDLAQSRAQFYGLHQLRFCRSPSPDKLPDELGTFDAVVLSAVYEHLLPDERRRVLTQLWQCLNPGGILFLNQTPYRWFPFEGHTTRLPLINYLPDRLALHAARRFSDRVRPGQSWQTLLRRGIRGGTPRQILSILKTADPDSRPTLLKPSRPGLRDRIDTWYAGYAVSIAHKYPRVRRIQKLLRIVAKAGYKLTGIVCLPTLAVAVRKNPKQ